MPDFLALPAEDRREALAVAAGASGRPSYLLEKDIWVVWAIQQIFAGPLGDHLVFKGGTSLSKGYGIIRRFSEDVDLTYDIRKIIPDLVGDSAAALPKSRSQAKKWSDEIYKRLAATITDRIAPQLTEAIAARRLSATISAEPDKIFIDYDPVSTGYEYVRPRVTLEFGARSTGEPCESVDISCDASPHLNGITFPSARPRAMNPQRTFWEKATAIHVYCHRGEFRGGDRFARHWHDLVRLDNTGYADRAITNRHLAKDVADQKSTFFSEKGRDGTNIDYHRAVTGALLLVPRGEAMKTLHIDYKGMVDGGLFLDDAEPFERIIERCVAIQAKANAV